MVQTRSQSNAVKRERETLSGEIIKLLFDYQDDASFIDKQEYTNDEIYDFYGGILLSVLDKTSLISINKILNTEYDYSRNKYG